MDPFSLALGIGGIGASLFGQSRTNDMQQQMMAHQQSFQERMSSTAYQRASSDMTAAGLNPMMMFSSGSAASTPAGAAPSGNVKSGMDADAMSKMISSATQMRVADATINNLVEQNAKIKAETATETKRPALLVADTGLRKSQGETEKYKPDVLRGDARVINLRGDILRNDAVTSGNEESMPKDARRLLDIGGYGGKKVREIVSPVGEVISSARRARSLFSDRFHY